jgi:CRISPR/Cas system-associated exonuclease Cas4 (RecB family)
VNATVGAYNENTKTFRTYLYDCDRYDIEDIHKLQVGDILVADGRLFKIVEKSENPSGEILVRTDDGYEIYFTQVEEEEYQARLTDDDRMLMHVFAVLDLPLADGVVYEDNSNPDLDAEPVVYTGLDDILKAKKEKEETKNVFLQPSLPVKLNLESFPVQTSFKQSNQSRDFIKGDDEEERQKMYLNLGNILHNLFSSIRTADDIPAAITRLEEQGVLYGNELTRQKLVNMIDERLHSPKVADWFSARWQVFNECTILEYNPEEKNVVEHRPDRVITDGQQFIVIDFKFGKPNGEYETQVRRYMSTLKSMGYEQVQGYLWYVYSNKTQEVFLDASVS